MRNSEDKAMTRYFRNHYLALVFKHLMEGYGYTVTVHYIEGTNPYNAEWCVEYVMENEL